jgi:hypothetical protein
MMLRNSPQPTSETIFGHENSTALIERLEDNLIVYKQLRFGASKVLNMDGFLEETREAFKVIGEHYKKSESLPILVVNYENCQVGKMSHRILQLGVLEIFNNLTNKYGDKCNVYVTGVGGNILLGSFIHVGAQIMRTKNLIDEFKLCDNLEDAMKLATERSKIVSSKKEIGSENDINLNEQ